MNQTQIGLLFTDDSADSFTQHPAGYFDPPQLTAEQLRRHFAAAETHLANLSDPAVPFMSKGLAMAAAMLEMQMAQLGNPITPITLRHVGFDSDLATVATFCEHAMRCESQPMPGIEARTSQGRNFSDYIVYSENIGTITVMVNNKTSSVTVWFEPWRAPVLKRRLVNRRRVAAPALLWQAASAAGLLSEAERSRANVVTFSHAGREYVCVDTFAIEHYEECTAWSFTLLADWAGQTSTVADRLDAWDAASIERGDWRGVVVKVRGTLCVLDEDVTFFDGNTPTKAPSLPLDPWR